MKSFSFLCAIGLVGLAFCAGASARDMVNLVPNAGFESGMPAPWFVHHTGDYSAARDPEAAHSGDFLATFAWRNHPKGGYSALCTPKIKVYPGVTYEVGAWARGKGSVSQWIVTYTRSEQFQGTNFGKAFSLRNEWQHFTRTWTAPGGIHWVALFLRVSPSAVASFDDVSFSYDRDKFTPPEGESIEVAPKVKASDAEYKLYLNDSPFERAKKIAYGECILAIEARKTGPNPRLSGSVKFGDHVVKLDERWRAAPLPALSPTEGPAGDAWKRSGFDDRSWKPVDGTGDGIWEAGGTESAAFRRVVLWKSSRRAPWEENQWLVMMRDRMYVAEGSTGVFAFVVRAPSASPASHVTMHIEAPAFLRLMEISGEGAAHWTSNLRCEKLQQQDVKRGEIDYVHYEITYRLPKKSPYVPYSPLFFEAAERIDRSRTYTFTFWRESNGNVTDVPQALPLIVTGPVNGRQCKYFHLSYNKPPITYITTNTYSFQQRRAMLDTLADAGMNVAWVPRGCLRETRGMLDSFLALKERGVQLCWQFNYGMNCPSPEIRSPLREHPEFHAKFYEGSREAFESSMGHRQHDMTGKHMWCQEYLAGGGKVFYDNLAPGVEEGKKKLGEILYTMWDWEYPICAWSCFCNRCKSAFRKFANVPDDLKLTDELIVTQYPQQWKEFRLDQSARHARAMLKFLKEYDIVLTVWSPTPSIEYANFNYRLLKDVYEYHFWGWPGSDLPLMGAGRHGGFSHAWKEMNPDIHIVAQTIVDTYRSHVIDERMFKVWTLNVALGTAGGGWLLWLDATYPFNQTHGQSYFMGEATRLIHDFEGFFKTSRHVETKFHQEGLKGRFDELIALEGPDGKEALVLLFNQSDEPAEVAVTVKDAAPGWTRAQQWEGKRFDAAKVTVTVPARDVVALHYTRQ